ncbi:MAG TPA: MFS transporter [Actinomycetota bacterium]|nr:MFS transporter [Actinomycetota bacterium]
MTSLASEQRSEVAGVQRRTIGVLSAAQVVSGMGISVGFALSALVVEELSGSTAISGLAATAVVLGAAVFALPTARAAGRGGRRAGLSLAYGTAFAGSVLTVTAIGLGKWPLLLAGLFLMGAGTAGNLSARYAASDLAPPGHAARHLSWVVWAATIGAVAGPNLAQPAADLGLKVGLAPTAGPFAVAGLTFAVAAVILNLGLRPDPLIYARRIAASPVEEPPPVRVTAGAAWAALKVVPAARRGLLAIAVSHTAMVSIMSMTPVHLHQGHADLVIIGVVISLHVAGMYLLSPVIGWLADRAGKQAVLVAGMMLLLAAAATAGMAGHNVPFITWGLFLLGVGWSCGLIAGSSMLSEALALQLRPAVQGFSDLVMNVCGAGGALLAGAVMGATSYQVLSLVVSAMVVATALALIRAGGSKRIAGATAS